MSHTPGPWEVSKHGVPEGIYQAGIYAEGENKDLAIVCSTAADANLIAAAPDLLEACKTTLDTMQWALMEKQPSTGSTDPCVMACQDLSDVVEKAINKAEGKS